MAAKKKSKKKGKARSKSVSFKQRVETFCQSLMTIDKKTSQKMTQSDAYRKSYPSSKKWKPATVHKRASEMMKRGEVVGRLKEMSSKQLKQHEASIATTLQFLANVVNLDIRELYDEKGKPLPLHKLPAHVAMAIGTDGACKLTDKNRSATLLGMYFNLWKGDGIPLPEPAPAPVIQNNQTNVFMNISPEQANQEYEAFINGEGDWAVD